MSKNIWFKLYKNCGTKTFSAQMPILTFFLFRKIVFQMERFWSHLKRELLRRQLYSLKRCRKGFFIGAGTLTKTIWCNQIPTRPRQQFFCKHIQGRTFLSMWSINICQLVGVVLVKEPRSLCLNNDEVKLATSKEFKKAEKNV